MQHQRLLLALATIIAGWTASFAVGGLVPAPESFPPQPSKSLLRRRRPSKDSYVVTPEGVFPATTATGGTDPSGVVGSYANTPYNPFASLPGAAEAAAAAWAGYQPQSQPQAPAPTSYASGVGNAIGAAVASQQTAYPAYQTYPGAQGTYSVPAAPTNYGPSGLEANYASQTAAQVQASAYGALGAQYPGSIPEYSNQQQSGVIYGGGAPAVPAAPAYPTAESPAPSNYGPKAGVGPMEGVDAVALQQYVAALEMLQKQLGLHLPPLNTGTMVRTTEPPPTTPAATQAPVIIPYTYNTVAPAPATAQTGSGTREVPTMANTYNPFQGNNYQGYNYLQQQQRPATAPTAKVISYPPVSAPAEISIPHQSIAVQELPAAPQPAVSSLQAVQSIPYAPPSTPAVQKPYPLPTAAPYERELASYSTLAPYPTYYASTPAPTTTTTTQKTLPPPSTTSIHAITQQIRRLPAVLYVDSRDPDSKRMETLLRDTYGLPLVAFYVDKIDKPKAVERNLQQLTAHKGMPYLFICGTFIGSAQHIDNYHSNKQIPQLVEYVCGDDKKRKHRMGKRSE